MKKTFFSIDTNHIDDGLNNLQAKYRTFFPDFMGNILGVDQDMIQKGMAPQAITTFIRTYKGLYDSSQLKFKNFDQPLKEITEGFRYAKHYFPEYKTPGNIVTFLGPLDASFPTSFGIQSDILTNEAAGIGLQLHMGKDFSVYKSQESIAIYPEYISRQFDAGFIAINVMKNTVDDMFPEKNEDLPMVQQMVEKGKRLYVLSKVLPHNKENELIGYSTEEMAICKSNEAVIWNLFVQNNYLQITDKNIIKNYIGQSPKTQEIVSDNGTNAPGNIGSFSGWQIVKKYMGKNPETTLTALMKMDPETVYIDSKYKP